MENEEQSSDQEVSSTERIDATIAEAKKFIEQFQKQVDRNNLVIAEQQKRLEEFKEFLKGMSDK